MNRLGIAMIALIVFFQSSAVLYGVEEGDLSRVIVLPLEVSQQGRYSYLENSIRQMLISRLVRQGNIEIIDFNAAGKEIDKLRTSLNAGDITGAMSGVSTDWLVDGKLYSMKDGLQVNLTFYPAETGVKPAMYTLKSATPDGVMPALTRLVADITEGIFSSEKQEDVVSAEAAKTGLEGFRTPHPERDYRKGLYGGSGLFGEGKDERFKSRGIRKSSELPIMIETMALGDLDGDNNNELVVSSRSKIRIFTFKQSKFAEVAEYDFSPSVKIHAINIADLEKTGTNRLFVSANDGKYPASAILSWDGGDELQSVYRGIRWYIRPIQLSEKEVVLAGQKDSPNVSDRFLAPGVFKLELDMATGKIKKGPKVLLPKKVNLFDFVIADLNGDSSPETVVIDEQQKLLIYDEVLNLIWVSSANYGGSNRYFGPSPAKDDNLDSRAYSESEGGQRELVYIPGRMDIKDITGDGLPEIVVNSNEVNVASEYLANFRGYDGGSVACLSWRGAGLMELWRTNHIEGYVADYAFDGDGEVVGDEHELLLNRLFVAQIPDSTFWDKFIPGGNNSKILAYEMQVKKEVKVQ